jgi:site-specific DNA-adenine methylase
MNELHPPTSYQGGKQRLAGKILDIIQPKNCMFWDLCCGSGAVSIELVRRGYDPQNVTMVDAGPWGLVWQMIGEGTFDQARFEKLLSEIPNDLREVQAHVRNLSRLDPSIDTPYIFLILQASSFGSKAIWIKDGKWQNCSFRDYWLPTATSSRRSPVNPMMPLPQTLLERVKTLCKAMKGVKGIYGDLTTLKPSSGVVYIDPPYIGTTAYGTSFDIRAYVKTLSVPVYVSEGMGLSDDKLLLSEGRAKGGISGARKTANEEWLSCFNVEMSQPVPMKCSGHNMFEEGRNDTE